MVKIEYVPYQKLVIHEIIEQENATFFEDILRQALAQPVQMEPTVNWIDGIAFAVGQMPPTEDIVKDNLGGKIHLASVIYTRIDFQSQVKVTIGNQSYSVRLRKGGNNRNFVDLARYLKDFKPSPAS